MRNQRHRAHAEHLRERKHDESRVAGGTDARERGVAQVSDEVQINQKIERLKEHACGHRYGHLHDVLGDRAFRQVLQFSLPRRS